MQALIVRCQRYKGNTEDEKVESLLEEASALEDDEERYEVFWEITNNIHLLNKHLEEIVTKVQKFEDRRKPYHDQGYQTSLLMYIVRCYQEGNGRCVLEAVSVLEDEEEQSKVYAEMLKNNLFISNHGDLVMGAIEALKNRALRNELLKSENDGCWCTLY